MWTASRPRSVVIGNHRHGGLAGRHADPKGTVQVLTDPTGFPLWGSEVRPGSSHDLTAAWELVVPLLYPHVPRALPVLVGERYTGAGVDIRVPIIGLRDAPMTLAPYPRLPLTPDAPSRGPCLE